MSKDIAISVNNVYKSFKIPHERQNSLKSSLINIFKKKSFTQYDAAKGISFKVKRGEFLGIVGRNGCGKSTMLKMLAGIYRPDKGSIVVDGRLSPFLELGVGFNPELSAKDNVYLNGTMLGLSKKEIDEKFDEIISFAELEEFVDQKLKNFSSGMQVRLAFSVAIQAHADILLIDEVLAVGDMNFQIKCAKVFHNLKKQGKTIVFVTHDMGAIQEYCDRVIMLKDGKIFKEGNPKDVAFEYEKNNLSSNSFSENWGDNRLSVSELICSENVAGEKPMFGSGKKICINFNLKNLSNEVLDVNASVEVFKASGEKCFGTTTNKGQNVSITRLAPGDKKDIQLSINRNYLLPGEYYIDYRFFTKDFDEILYAKSFALNFTQVGDSKDTGIFDLGAGWSLINGALEKEVE